MSNNVFADLELPNPEERLLKASIVLAIRGLVASSEMTQAQIALQVGLTQPAVSRLLNGMTKDISVEKLLSVVTALGRDICISIEEQPESKREERQHGHIRVQTAAASI